MSDFNHHFVQLDDQGGSYALISENRDTDVAVVFVHGFLGDAKGTWLNFQEMIDSCAQEFPKWTRSDAFFFAYQSFQDSITDSAETLLKTVDILFPDPPKSLFNVKASIPHLAPSLISFTLDHRVYNELVLIGHSEGAVIIRRAVCIAYKTEGPDHKILNARLSLFAPAHFGFVPTGWIGACLAVGQIDAIVMPILRTSPSFCEMKERVLLDQIRTDTGEFLKKWGFRTMVITDSGRS